MLEIGRGKAILYALITESSDARSLVEKEFKVFSDSLVAIITQSNHAKKQNQKHASNIGYHMAYNSLTCSFEMKSNEVFTGYNDYESEYSNENIRAIEHNLFKSHLASTIESLAIRLFPQNKEDRIEVINYLIKAAIKGKEYINCEDSETVKSALFLINERLILINSLEGKMDREEEERIERSQRLRKLIRERETD